MNLNEIEIKVEKIKDGGDYEYIATSRDLPGLLVAGETIEEVLTLAPEVAKALTASISEFKHLDQALQQKYGMDFEQFHAQKVAQKQGYTWEVEKDAMDWETAIGYIQTLERKFKNPQ